MIKYVFGLIILINVCAMAQESNFIHDLYYDYLNYKESSLLHKRIKYADIIPLIGKLKGNKLFEVSKAGQSARKKDIYLVKYGKGEVKLFLWSQMHGDESTATMGLFDIFNFLASSDRYNDLRNRLYEKLTIYFMPMVNPDGAEVYQRRNAFDIDINRDYINQRTPEAKILRSVFDSIQADFGFNLHDQNGSYAAGDTSRNAAISFLAPAMNYNKDVTSNRKVAMQVIAAINRSLKDYIPGHIAKYNDDFEPRAFGDNFQKEGMSTILIESGGWLHDTEKQFLRKLNFLALLSAFINIAESNYKGLDVNEYDNIPFNKELFSDVILRNAVVKRGKKSIVADVAINRVEKNSKDYKTGYYESEIADIGDLTGLYGLEEYDCTGMTLEPGKIFGKTISNVDSLEETDINKIFLSGCTTIRVKKIPDTTGFCKYPINICSKSAEQKECKVESPADFVLYKDGEVVYVMVNGYLYDPVNETGYIANGRIDR